MIYANMFAGVGADVAPDVRISPGVRLELGDHVSIGPGVHIIGKGCVRFGDYSKVHAGSFINVQDDDSYVIFGCNTWIGERCVIDGTGGLTAGDNVGIGIGSHLYTHIAHGDTLAGCRFKSEKRLTIADDAWFVGQCLVSPVTVGERSMAMLGSVITHDMAPNSVYAGVPATDVTSKLRPPWIDRPVDEKLAMFEAHVQEFCALKGYPTVPIVGCKEFPTSMSDRITYFNVATRTYTKTLSFVEVEFMMWLTSWRGRFTPEGDR